MTARAWLAVMIIGSALVIATASRSAEVRPPPPRPVAPETPWLTPEAAAQVVEADGRLGPLFAGLVLGAPAPAEVRERIAAFARANHVALDLEVVDGDVAAVRFEVAYGGCCGYEAADVLARRIGRPATSSCCGCEASWLDDWTVATEDGGFLRARVRINRVILRWERQLGDADLIDRAAALVGQPRVAAARAAGDRWREIEPNRRYLLEVPYPADGYPVFALGERDVEVVATAGRIVEVGFTLRPADPGAPERDDVLRARWGRPRVRGDRRWTWQLPDRAVTAELAASTTRVTVRAR